MNVRLDDGEPDDRAGHGDVKRVDVELVEFERLVSLVLGAAVIEVVAFEIARRDITTHLSVSGAVCRNHLEQNNVRILEALGLVDGEDERRFEMDARGRLVFVAQYDTA